MTSLTVPFGRKGYSAAMDNMSPSDGRSWDAGVVWHILLRRHPVHVEHPATSCGRIDRETLAEFCEAIADYPDFLQDALLVIAHAEGFAAAIAALDAAVREYLADQSENNPSLVPAE